jgi:hypothetical protein
MDPQQQQQQQAYLHYQSGGQMMLFPPPPPQEHQQRAYTPYTALPPQFIGKKMPTSNGMPMQTNYGDTANGPFQPQLVDASGAPVHYQQPQQMHYPTTTNGIAPPLPMASNQHYYTDYAVDPLQQQRYQQQTMYYAPGVIPGAAAALVGGTVPQYNNGNGNQQQHYATAAVPTSMTNNAQALAQQYQGGGGGSTMVTVKDEPSEDRPSGSSHSANTSSGLMGDSPHQRSGDGTSSCMGSAGLNKSRFRGVSYDRKKAKWRVQIKVAALGKSGVSVGYFETEEAAARAYDRAAIGLLGRDNANLQTNFALSDYNGESIPPLSGKTREEVKTTLKTERIRQAPRRRFTSRQRTSRFVGVGSSNRKNQWQARILVHGKVTHLGYYETEEEAARVYDRVSIALHGQTGQTNFPISEYSPLELEQYRGLDREDLQRALGVKPMDKSSQYRGVSRKKGKWEAKVMVNRRWAYRELFDSEEEAARAYDRALWRLKPKEARSYVNFKDEVPVEIAEMLARDGGGGGGGYGGGRGRQGGGAAALHTSDLDFHSDDEDDEDAEVACSDYDDDDGGDVGYKKEYLTGAADRRSGRTSLRRRGSAGQLEQEDHQNHQQKEQGEQCTAAAANSRAYSDVVIKQEPQEYPNNLGGGGGDPAGGATFVAMPGGGLQLQLPGGTSIPGMIPSPGSDQHLSGMAAAAAPTGSGGSDGHHSIIDDDNNNNNNRNKNGTKLLVRVGSEVHLIPGQQETHRRSSPPGGGGSKGGHTTLGKRSMQRIRSEPYLPIASNSPPSLLHNNNNNSTAANANANQNNNDNGITGGEAFLSEFLSGPDMFNTAHSGDMDLSEGIFDFINNLPDLPPSAGMVFRNDPLGGDNLEALDDELLAALEFTRPRKMAKSMSMNDLAGANNAINNNNSSIRAGTGTGGSGSGGGNNNKAGRPPLPPKNGGNTNNNNNNGSTNSCSSSRSPPAAVSGDEDDKLGPLGQPMRRTNTFTASLQSLDEGADEGIGHIGHMQQHSSEEDLVQQLMNPAGHPYQRHGGGGGSNNNGNGSRMGNGE